MITLAVALASAAPRPFSAARDNGDGTVSFYYPGDAIPALPAGSADSAYSFPGAFASGADVAADLFGVPVDGSDCFAALTALIARFKSGELWGRLVLRRTPGGAGYRTSGEIVIDFAPFEMHLEDSLTGAFTTKQSTLKISGPSISAPIRGVRLTGNGRAKIDGNAPNIAPYTHNPSDTLYSAVLLRWVKDFYVSGLHFDRGLVNSFRTFQCGRGLVELCRFSGAANDNGCSIDFDPATFDPANQETWANVEVRHSVAWANNDYGFTAFDASRVTFRGCHAYANGQMTDPNGVGGGFSYEDSFSSPKGKADYQGRFIGCHAYGNTGNGFFITADGVQVDENSTATGSVYSDATKPDAPQQFGHGVIGISVRRFICEAVARGNTKAGVRLLGANGHHIEAKIGGECVGNAERGIDAQGVALLRVLPSFSANGNGLGTVAKREGVNIDNAAINNGGGTVYVDGGQVSQNGGAAVKTQRVNRVFYSGVVGFDPGQSGITTAGLQIENASLAVISGCTMDGPSSQSYSASIISTAASAITGVVGRSVSGAVLNTSSALIPVGSA